MTFRAAAAEYVKALTEIWKLCKRRGFVRRGPCLAKLCALAYAATLNPIGRVVRCNYYIYAYHELDDKNDYDVLAKAATRLVKCYDERNIIDYEQLLAKAIAYYEYLRVRGCRK